MGELASGRDETGRTGPQGGPLAGLTVLDLTRLLPGGYCTLLLADLGADVIKVEEPGRGDHTRAMGPPVGGVSAAHLALNRGKRSITLNLKRPAGVDVMRRLASRADAVVESFRPGVLDRLGVGFEALRTVNPSLVFASITGYGQDGPYRDRVGHDLNYIGYGGVLSMAGSPGGRPVPPGVQVGDLGGGGMLGAIGVLAALHERQTTGRGRFVDVSMLDGVVSWLSIHAASFLATGDEPGPGAVPLGGGLACYRVYRAKDGRWLTVAALEPRFWEALCTALELPDLEARQLDPDQEAVAGRLQAAFESRTREEWLDLLADTPACVGPVNSVGEALADPQVRHRGMLAEIAGEPVGPGPVPRLAGVPRGPLRPAPALGEHTGEVLTAIGIDAAGLQALRADGAI